jgi:hypothetical protein
LVALAPLEAEAQIEDDDATDFLLQLTGYTYGTLGVIGGLVTGIGSAVQLGRDWPGLGWGIAALVVGVLDVLGGTAFLVASLRAEIPPLAAYTGAIAGLGATDIALGIAVIVLRASYADVPFMVTPVLIAGGGGIGITVFEL